MPEEPIVVSGGSVTVDFSDAFNPDSPAPGKHKYKRAKGKLTRVVVDGKEVGDKNPKKVEIFYDTEG